jgi:hypothetical protein
MDQEDKTFLVGAGLGAAGMAVAASIAGIVRSELSNDPLRPALHPEAQVSPDGLADEIAKDPKLQQRWKPMREFVEKVDREVGQNLEQSAGGSQETAKHWRDRVDDAKGPEAGVFPTLGKGGIRN